MYAHVKNITDIEYKDTKIKDFTYREIYKKGNFEGYTIFYKTHQNNKCERLLSMFFNSHEKYIKNINDFNIFIDNLETNLKIVNQITDNLNWFWNNKKSENNFKNINKEIFFSTENIKNHYFKINKIFTVDTNNFLLRESNKETVRDIINLYNDCEYLFCYDVENMEIKPNLKCKVWTI